MRAAWRVSGYNGGMENAFQNVRTDELSRKWAAATRRGRELYNRGNGIRSEFERDYTRLLHCRAYRRLKHKTQVFFAPRNDHVCTRMEHVGHVSSVAGTIARHLGLNEDLTRAIAIGHDIGHAPFGHHGEEVLNDLLGRKEGANAPKKFWHERNSLFFADYIETLPDPDGRRRPLDLTYAVRDGLICHCGEIDQQGMRPREEAIDLYDVKVPGMVQPFTWEGCVVKVSDKIAFLGRDLEDALLYRILDRGSWRELREIVAETLGVGSPRAGRSGRAVNTTVLINDMIVDLCARSNPEDGLLFSESYARFIAELKRFSFRNIYNPWRLQEFQRYATVVLETIYRTLMRVQPFVQHGTVPLSLAQDRPLGSTFEEWLVAYTNYSPKGDPEKKRRLRFETPAVFNVHDNSSYEKCVIEFLSGMTDTFAIECYDEIITF